MPDANPAASGTPVGRAPVVTFLSDFGHEDIFVGVCHGVILRHAPAARIVDLTHAVPPQDVATGAARLRDAVVHVPAAVHLAVVDPGVGSDRAAVVMRSGPVDDPSYLVGPDNGLLLPAAAALGGVRGVWRVPVPAAASATFHGRDVFAPAAGRLAAGSLPDSFGAALHGEPVALPGPTVATAFTDVGVLRTTVRDIDHFGNVQTCADRDAWDRLGGGGARVQVGIRPQAETRGGTAGTPATLARTFAALAPGETGVIVDSAGWLAVVTSGGSAASALTVARGDEVTLRAAGTAPEASG